jgi:DNA-binding NarL/FixJ family response regulator
MRGIGKALVGAREPTPQPESLLGRRWEESYPARKRALLVVKHFVFRQALALVLELHTDFRVVHAGSFAEVHQFLSAPDAEQPDLVVLDLELPTVDGVELIRGIHEVWPRTPVLALTSGQNPERAGRAKEAGADEVLTMAASGEEFLEGVMRLENG